MKPRYAPLEEATCYNFTDLFRKVKQEANLDTARLNVDWLREFILKELQKFVLNGQSFEFIYKANKFRGERWYVLCPKCGRHSIKLYLPDKLPDREQSYACKICHRLKPSCLLLGGTEHYQQVLRPMKRLEKIKETLLNKGITPHKAEPLLDEYEELEKNLVKSAAYRLWKFRQQHAKVE